MSTDHDHDHEHDHDADPGTDEIHENSWSVNLELPEYADDPEGLFEDALEAIRHTAAGHHVNLVTHGELGHPEGYLYGRLEESLADRDVEWEYVEQCGCGGHVTRVYVDD